MGDDGDGEQLCKDRGSHSEVTHCPKTIRSRSNCASQSVKTRRTLALTQSRCSGLHVALSSYMGPCRWGERPMRRYRHESLLPPGLAIEHVEIGAAEIGAIAHVRRPRPVRCVVASRSRFTAATTEVWLICRHTAIAFGSGWWFDDFDVASRVVRGRSSPSGSRRRPRRVLVSYGRYPDAITALTEGLMKGGLK